MCLLTIAIVNMVLCLFFGISGTPGASNYLLAIYMANLAMYFLYYCIMKVEKNGHLEKKELVKNEKMQ